MADLVSGGYPQGTLLKAWFGPNVTQSNLPARSNAEYLGFGGWTDGALAATGVSCSVPIPVDPGTIITNVKVIVGATAEATGTHSFVALYSGIATPALLGQSTDDTGAASFAASAVKTVALTTPYLVKPTDVPNGFLYATVCITAGTIPTAAVMATATAVTYQLNSSTAPLGHSLTHGSAQGATAAATIATPSAKAVAPIIGLT